MLCLAARSDLLREQDSIFFKLLYLAPKGRHDARTGRLDGALDQRIDLFLDLRCLPADWTCPRFVESV